jgi:hemoglobin-like flavoprotein
MSLDIDALERSFELVKHRGDEFSSQFYGTLFSDHPDVKPLFTNTHLEEQGKKLFASLVLVIANLREPETLADALRGLGTRHVRYGVLPQHYPWVGSTLLKTFEAMLNSTDWTPNVQQAWTEAYGEVTQLMLEGADYSPEILNLSH